MEASRLGIKRESSPTIVLQNYMFFSDIGEKGIVDIQWEVVGQKVEPDESGNDQVKYILEAISVTKKDLMKARLS